MCEQEVHRTDGENMVHLFKAEKRKLGPPDGWPPDDAATITKFKIED